MERNDWIKIVDGPSGRKYEIRQNTVELLNGLLPMVFITALCAAIAAISHLTLDANHSGSSLTNEKIAVEAPAAGDAETAPMEALPAEGADASISAGTATSKATEQRTVASHAGRDPASSPSVRIGARLTSLDDVTARQRGLPGAMGALIEEVIPDGPADRSGLRAGDVVLGINGEFVDGIADVQREMSQVQPGDAISLRLLREGQEFRIDVEAGKAEPTSSVSREEATDSALIETVNSPLTHSQQGGSAVTLIPFFIAIVLGSAIALNIVAFLPALLLRKSRTSFSIDGEAITLTRKLRRNYPDRLRVSDIAGISVEKGMNPEKQNSSAVETAWNDELGVFNPFRPIFKTNWGVYLNARGRYVYLANYLSESEAEFLRASLVEYLNRPGFPSVLRF